MNTDAALDRPDAAEQEHDKNSKEIAENMLLGTPRWILDVLFPTRETTIHNQRHLQLAPKEGELHND
jgi:hypothetical protein